MSSVKMMWGAGMVAEVIRHKSKSSEDLAKILVVHEFYDVMATNTPNKADKEEGIDPPEEIPEVLND